MRTLSIVLFSLGCFGMSAIAQQQPQLTVGDKAPELQYGKWLKGTPIKEYEKGRLYLFEFWATWCGPCIASMPHLSEFARERKHQATVIAVDIWEGNHGGKPYESYWPKVERFVGQMGNKMDFNVVTDSKDEFMGNNWMKAAGQDGIPCTIMVKDGIILWMGHPIELDSIVNIVLAGKYDMETAKREKAEKDRQNDSAMAPFTNVFKRYEALSGDKQYDKAMALLDSAMANMPAFAGTLGFFKFNLMIDNLNEDSAMVFVREWQKTKPGYTGSTAAVIVRKKGLKKSTYQYGLALLNEQLKNPQMPANLAYAEMASAYANMGDYKQAVEKQGKALAAGKQYLKEGKFAGFIIKDTITELEKQLAEYKKKLK
ncbi:TlpA family protein disulfide reductase [Chitinophaga sp. 22321]